MPGIVKETITQELLYVLSPSTVIISDPTVAVEQVRAMHDAIEVGGEGREIVSRYTSRGWELLTYYKAIAEGLGGEGLSIADEAALEQAEPLARIMQILTLDGLASVVPAVKDLMQRMREADVHEDGSPAEGSMIHFYGAKTWHSVEYWKAEADGLNNPYSHKTVTIDVSKGN